MTTLSLILYVFTFLIGTKEGIKIFLEKAFMKSTASLDPLFNAYDDMIMRYKIFSLGVKLFYDFLNVWITLMYSFNGGSSMVTQKLHEIDVLIPILATFKCLCCMNYNHRDFSYSI